MSNLFDPMNVLTLGLLVFAGAQVWVTLQGEKSRRHERRQDEKVRLDSQARELDLAYQTLWAEHFRLDALADAWESGDLVQMSLAGVLRPEDVLPRDWATQTTMFGRLGQEAGYLGGVAITQAHDLAREVANLNSSLEDLFAADDERSIGLKAEHVRKTVGGSRLAMLEARIRRDVRELSLLTWDAVQHSPRGDVVRELRFRDHLTSAIGKSAVAALADRAKQSDPSTGGT